MEYYIIDKSKIDTNKINVNAYLSVGDKVVLNKVAFSLLCPSSMTLKEFAEQEKAVYCANVSETKIYIENYGE